MLDCCLDFFALLRIEITKKTPCNPISVFHSM